MQEEDAKIERLYGTALETLHGLVGNYENMKELNEMQEAMMCALALADTASDFSGRVLSDTAFDQLLRKDKFVELVTVLYLYCNWRVWATYKHNEELARKYQSVCDDIDNYIFDNYEKKDIAYFVRETD